LSKKSDWLIAACCLAYISAVVAPTGIYAGVWKLATGEKAADWAQAIAAFVALLAGAAGLAWQERRRDEEAKARKVDLAAAAGTTARGALLHVIERLAPLIRSDAPFLFLLRGHRTTEMVEALRSIDVSELPADVVEPLADVRGAVRAVNERITDVLALEEKKPEARDRRLPRLESSGRVLGDAIEQFDRLREVLASRYGVELAPISVQPAIQQFIEAGLAASESSTAAYD
jgi:hypothetical protein